MKIYSNIFLIDFLWLFLFILCENILYCFIFENVCWRIYLRFALRTRKIMFFEAFDIVWIIFSLWIISCCYAYSSYFFSLFIAWNWSSWAFRLNIRFIIKPILRCRDFLLLDIILSLFKAHSILYNDSEWIILAKILALCSLAPGAIITVYSFSMLAYDFWLWVFLSKSLFILIISHFISIKFKSNKHSKFI